LIRVSVTGTIAVCQSEWKGVTAVPLNKKYQLAHYMESIVRSSFVKETHLSSRASASLRTWCVPGESLIAS
jgi:hypothetical protein